MSVQDRDPSGPELEMPEQAEAAPEHAPPEQALPEADPQALAAERDRLLEENNALKEQLLRRRADFDNLRKRTQREREDFVRFASLEIAGELLPVLDGLERALAAAPEAEDDFHQGIALIARQLLDILTRYGLEPIESLGRKFDPHLHQAVERVVTDEHEDQTILEEWQRGYTFKGRLLRAAMVKVAVRSESQ